MNNLSPEIRTAQRTDIPAILELMREFAEYESLGEYLEVTEESLADVMFGAGAFVKVLIAHVNEKTIAYAIFYPSFSSFRGQRSVYLEDIFITKDHRKHGLGELMLRAVAKAGKEFGAVRMDFQVLDWNLPAINFYKKHGTVIEKDERHFKFTDNAFQKLIKKPF